MHRAAFVLVGGMVILGCSSTPSNPNPAPSEGACGDGYLPAVNGSCPRGTCLEGEASASCCGSQCATCQDKGLVAEDDAGACPAGTCISSDLTVALTCCDTCPGDLDAGGDGASEGGGDGGLTEASPGASDASGE
jgi:hypothetical protein